MMFQVMRPVRASASRLLATPTGTTSTVDYQQPPAFAPTDSPGTVGAAPSPSTTGWNSGTAKDVQTPWPMQNVCDSFEFQGGAAQIDNSNVADHSFGSGAVWLQPVFLPVQTPCPGQQAACQDAAGNIWMFPVAAPQSSQGGMMSFATDHDQQTKASSSGVRKRQQAQKDSTAALGPDEVQELRRAVKETQEACFKFRGPSANSALPEASRAATALQQDGSQDLSTQMPILQLLVPSTADPAGNAEQDEERVSPRESSCSSEAAVDPVLLQLADADSESFQSTLDWVLRSTWPLAVTKRGCRIVQKALEVSEREEQQQIVNKLHGRIREAMVSPHANYVLQKCVEIMPPDRMQFMVTELEGDAAYFAKHRFGCRIMQRLIEHCTPDQTEGLIDELFLDAPRLCRHQYGNFVIQHILQHGSPAQRHAIAVVLGEDTVRLAKHRIGSHVLSCALAHCAAEDVKSLSNSLLGDSAQFADLSRRQYGSFVVREVYKAARSLHLPHGARGKGPAPLAE